MILGVTGCIGAYKAAEILRLLQDEGFDVLPVMTRSARKFITPLTLEKLSGNRVITDLFRDRTTRIEHIDSARSSDLLLVAPATANVLAKFARGIADDFLSTIHLSTRTPVVVAPAMNVEMWHHPATRENVDILRQRGVIVVEPDSGYLACGEQGEGRLAEPGRIVEEVLRALRRGKDLAGSRVLVTAGPTVEDFDPVRFLSNRSSGKMGFAIAREALCRGARVELVSGPTDLEAPPGVECIRVRSAADMADAVFNRFGESDVVVMAAAVTDFRPVAPSRQKIKKDPSSFSSTVRWERTPDILKELGVRKRDQFLVGFAAESEGLIEEARRKLADKNLDLIVANDISSEDQGFQSDFNQAVLIDGEGGEEALPRMPKTDLARILWDRIQSLRSSDKNARSRRETKLHGLPS